MNILKWVVVCSLCFDSYCRTYVCLFHLCWMSIIVFKIQNSGTIQYSLLFSKTSLEHPCWFFPSRLRQACACMPQIVQSSAWRFCAFGGFCPTRSLLLYDRYVLHMNNVKAIFLHLAWKLDRTVPSHELVGTVVVSTLATGVLLWTTFSISSHD